MDVESRSRWLDYSKAKDDMFAHTDFKQAPWYVVNADDKKRARLNCITHLLSLIPYQDLTPDEIALPPRQQDTGYVRPPMTDQTFVPEVHEPRRWTFAGSRHPGSGRANGPTCRRFSSGTTVSSGSMSGLVTSR